MYMLSLEKPIFCARLCWEQWAYPPVITSTYLMWVGAAVRRFVLPDKASVKNMVSKSSDILQIYHSAIDFFRAGPRVHISQSLTRKCWLWLRPTLNQLKLCTVLHFSHSYTPVWLRCIHSQFAYCLDSTKDSGVLPSSGIFAQVLLNCLLSVKIRWSPNCWLANGIVNDCIMQQQHCNQCN